MRQEAISLKEREELEYIRKHSIHSRNTSKNRVDPESTNFQKAYWRKMTLQRQNTCNRLKKAEEKYKGMFIPKINDRSRRLSAKRKSDLDMRERAKSPALMAPNNYFSKFLQKDWEPKIPFKP